MRILAVEGGAAGRERLTPRDAAGRRHDVVYIASRDDALALLDGGRFDAILLRDRLDALGLPALAALHEHAPTTPVVVVAPAEHEARALDAVRQGAQDCLIEGTFDEAHLGRVVAFAVERQRRQDELRGISLIDELTGLYNRRGFIALARQELRLARRMRHSITQLFLDLDGLKAINDALGHGEGDRALSETAELLKATFRDSDVIARISGDEFAVLVVDANQPAPDAMERRLREQLAERNRRPGRRYQLSVSVGAAVFDPASPCTVEELMARADAWMYAQKRQKKLERAAAEVPSYAPVAPPGETVGR